MGGSSSVSVKTVNEIMTDSIISVSKSCAASATNNYSLWAGYVGGDVILSGNVTQNASVIAICNQTSSIHSAVKAEMMSKIKALSESKDTNLLTGDVGFFNKASTNVDSTNRALMKMNTEDVQSCLATATNNYAPSFQYVEGNLIVDNTVMQNADAEIRQCLLESGIEQNLAFDLTQDVDAAAKRKGTLDSIMELLVPVLIAVGVVGAIVFGVVMYFKYRKQQPTGTGQAQPAIVINTSTAVPTATAVPNPIADTPITITSSNA